jgi:hypothetical protein
VKRRNEIALADCHQCGFTRRESIVVEIGGSSVTDDDVMTKISLRGSGLLKSLSRHRFRLSVAVIFRPAPSFPMANTSIRHTPDKFAAVNAGSGHLSAKAR